MLATGAPRSGTGKPADSRSIVSTLSIFLCVRAL